MGVKKFDISLEAQEKPNFLAGCPGIFAGISRGRPKSFRKKKLELILVPLPQFRDLGCCKGGFKRWGLESEEKSLSPAFSGFPRYSSDLSADKAEKWRKRPISRKVRGLQRGFL